MIGLISIYFLILIHVISNVHSQGSPGDRLGPSACDVYGVLQSYCGVPDVPIESFPKECSSYLYGFVEYENNTANDWRGPYQSIKGYLDKLIQTNTSVIVYYLHPTLQNWCDAIQWNNTAGQTAEMDSLKKFLDQHPGIKGICLAYLLQADDQPVECPDYSKNLKPYLDLMKKTFTNLSIGISIPAVVQQENYQSPTLPWLDFNLLDPLVDFYIFSVTDLNLCTDELLKTGIYPLTGNSNNTVDKARTLIEGGGASKSKIHYRFTVNPELKDRNGNFCLTFPISYCKNPADAKTIMCGDTIQTLVEKGAYAKEHGAGFVMNNIDTDDTDCFCQCGQPYPGFNALLSGYNGSPPPPPCCLFDRT